MSLRIFEWRTRLPRIAMVGTFQVGKSTTVNCLLRTEVAQMGIGLATTHAITAYVPYRSADAKPICGGVDDIQIERVAVRSELLTSCEIWDTPGYGAFGKDSVADDELFGAAIARADACALVVRNRQLSSVDIEHVLSPIRSAARPVIVLMNCVEGDTNPLSSANNRTAAAIAVQLNAIGIHPLPVQCREPVWPFNPQWYWIGVSTAEQEAGELDDQGRFVLGRIEAEYFARGLPKPSSRELMHMSNCEPIRSVLIGAGGTVRTLRNMAFLNHAFCDWRSELYELCRPALALVTSA